MTVPEREIARLRKLEVAYGIELSTHVERYVFAVDTGDLLEIGRARDDLLRGVLRFHNRMRAE